MTDEIVDGDEVVVHSNIIDGDEVGTRNKNAVQIEEETIDTELSSSSSAKHGTSFHLDDSGSGGISRHRVDPTSDERMLEIQSPSRIQNARLQPILYGSLCHFTVKMK